jgi:hypothetical protein
MDAALGRGTRHMGDDEVAKARAARLAELRAEIIPRLRRVCGETSDALFDEAVERAALIRLQLEERRQPRK